MSNLISDILKLVAVAGICVLGYYLYECYMEAKSRRAEEWHVAELDRQRREREEAEKKEADLRAKEEKRTQAKVEQEAALKEAEEARNRRREEARLLKIQEESMAKAREQVAKQAAKEEAEEKRLKSIADAQAGLTALRKEKFLLLSRKAELNRVLVATNNRIEGARKTAAEADAKSRSYAAAGGSQSTGDISGTSVIPPGQTIPPDFPPNTSFQSGDRGINSIRTDNSELIAKERARADFAHREVIRMQVVAGKAQVELHTVDKRLKEIAAEESSLEKTLRDGGEDPSKISGKGVAQAPNFENNGNNRVVLKDGTVLRAEKVIDFGSQFSIKTFEGKFVAVDKDKIESISAGLLPQK